MTASKIVGHADAADARAPYTPIALLTALDGWLAETGHDDGHPWRASIAKTLEAHRDEGWKDALAGLQNRAYDAAAVALALDNRIGHFCVHGSPDADDLITLARGVRVAADLVTELGDQLGNLSDEVAHG